MHRPHPRPTARIARHALVAAALLGAIPATAALAAPAGTTLLVSRPDGFGGASPGVVNHSSTFGDAGGNPGEHAPQVVSDDDGSRFVAFTSESDGLSPDDDDTVTNVYVRDRVNDVTILVSRANGPNGAGANGTSYGPSISADGRYVAFTSEATNLSDADENGTSQVYLRDLQTGTTTLVSRADGAAGLIASSSAAQASVAVNGSTPRVAFVSAGANLPGANGSPQVYMRNGTSTVLLSTVDGNAALAGGDRSSGPSLNSDGTLVAFTSEAALVPAVDTNIYRDVYVRVVAGDDVRLASRAAAVGNDDSYGGQVSDDGNRVSFTSRATNLAAADLDSEEDVFVRSLIGPTTILVSRATGGGGAAANGRAEGATISADGNRVVFSSTATNLAPTDTDGDPDVFLRVIGGATTRLVSAGPGSTAASGLAPSISRNGNRTAWQGVSPGREAADDDDFVQVYTSYTGDALSIFQSGWVSRPSGEGTFRSGVNDAHLRTPSRSGEVANALSRDGRYTVFVSQSDELSPDDDDRFVNVYRRDNLTGTTVLVSRADGPAGAAANGSSSGGSPGGLTTTASTPAVSDDGRVVVFESTASNLVAGDVNGLPDVFARDVVAGTTVLVSRAPDGTPLALGGGDPDVSGDGTRVVFTTAAPIDALDANNDPDVYLRDLTAGTTTLVGRQTGAAGALAPTGTGGAAISADGRVVAFTSRDPLAPGVVDANNASDVFVRFLDTATTGHVSRRAADATQAGDDGSFFPSISDDGSRVAFTSIASDLAAGDVNGGLQDVFLRPTVGIATTVLVSRTPGPGGISGNRGSSRATISGDGTRVVFETTASDLVPGDVNGAQDVVLRDVQADTTEIVGRRHDGGQIALGAVNASISPNGACVAFDSRDAAVVPGLQGSDFSRVFVRALGECPFGPVAPGGGETPGGPATPGGPGAGTPPPGGTAGDTTRPRVTLLAATPARFVAGARLRAGTRVRPAVGTRVRVRVSESARVSLRVDALLPGRRRGARCVAVARTGRACVRVVTRGTLQAGRVTGTRIVAFTGRLRGRALAPGRYRITAIAVDAAGNRSVARSVTVTVLRPVARR